MLPTRHPVVSALQEQAKLSLPPSVYDFFAGGSGDEITLGEAPDSWSRWRLRPKVLRDVSSVDRRQHLLGDSFATPIGVAPWAMQRMAHPDGELASARGCAEAGAIMTVSTTATTGLEEVAAERPDSPKWFQLYWTVSREFSMDLVRRAVASGYRGIVLTVDLPVIGHRWRDTTNEFGLPAGLTLPNQSAIPGQDNYRKRVSSQRPNLTFADLEDLVSATELPIIVKGVLRADDARRCVEAGASAVWVSTHGGRQLDPVISSAQALAPIVNEVGNDVEVYADGGIRTPADVLIALALGARGVFIGRPAIWALAGGGADGLAALINGFSVELENLMALCGVRTLAEIGPDLLIASSNT